MEADFETPPASPCTLDIEYDPTVEKQSTHDQIDIKKQRKLTVKPNSVTSKPTLKPTLKPTTHRRGRPKKPDPITSMTPN